MPTPVRFEPGCVLSVNRIADSNQTKLDRDYAIYINLLLEPERGHGEAVPADCSALIRGCRRTSTEGQVCYSIGLSREHHESIALDGPHNGLHALETYEIKALFSCIAEAYDDDLDPRSMRQVEGSVGTAQGGPEALMLSPYRPNPAPRSSPARPETAARGALNANAPSPGELREVPLYPLGGPPTQRAEPSTPNAPNSPSPPIDLASDSPPRPGKAGKATPTPTPEASSIDFLGLNSLGKGLWSVLELPKHLPLVCCAARAPARRGRRGGRRGVGEGEDDADEEEEDEEDEEEVRGGAGGARAQGAAREGRRKPDKPEEIDEFYEAASIDWAVVTAHPGAAQDPRLASPCLASTNGSAAPCRDLLPEVPGQTPHGPLTIANPNPNPNPNTPHGPLTIAKFDANVLFSFLVHRKAAPGGKTDTVAATAKAAAFERHISVHPVGGRVSLVDCSRPLPPLGAEDRLGELPASLGSLRALACLRLHNQGLTGPIPLSIWAPRMAYLEALDLSSNELTGSIDGSQFSCLPRLEVLNLSHNRLSGPLPPELGDILALESLMVNDNALTGAVPASIQRCRRLLYVDVKGNRLYAGVEEGKAREVVLALLPHACELYI